MASRDWSAGMSEPKFTPGPWEVRSDSYSEIITSKIDGCDALSIGSTVDPGFTIAVAFSDVSGISAKDNAHLIAAAPEMYEALKVALEVLHTSPMVGGAYHARRIGSAGKSI